MLKQKFFWLPILFWYSYKSIFYNTSDWKKLLLTTNIFWTSLSWFSYKLTSKQPVKLSTLKLLKNWEKILYFFNKIISTENWITFTITDLQDIFLSVKELKKHIEQKFNLQKDFEIFIIEKKFISFLLKYEKFFYLNDLNDNLSIHNYKYFFNNKSIFGSSISTDIYFFLYKLFSFNIFNIDKKKFIFNLKTLNNKIIYTDKSILEFFYQVWVFIFFPNKNNKFKNFLNLLSLVEKLKIINGLIFNNGMIFFLNDLGLLKFCKKFDYKRLFYKKKLSTLLKFFFFNSFKTTKFIFISDFTLKYNKYNVYYYLLTSFYFFNNILISFFLINLLKIKLNIFLPLLENKH